MNNQELERLAKLGKALELLYSKGAVYMNDEDYYPPELQYLSYSLDGLMSHILRDSDLLEVVPRFKI